jgi:lipid A 3-O-deacylase
MAFAIQSRSALFCVAVLATLSQAPDASAQIVSSSAKTAQVQPAPAQPMPQPTPPIRIVDEVKLGLLVHDVGLFGHHRETGEDVNAEILFVSPNILRYIWSPRPHFGIDANGSGNTTNYYAGLTWGGTFYRPGWSRGDGFFALLSAGGSVNDGKISTTNPQRKSLGSHELFKEGLDLGYQINEVVNVAAYLDHISNAGLATRNEGLTSAGVRFGYKF